MAVEREHSVRVPIPAAKRDAPWAALGVVERVAWDAIHPTSVVARAVYDGGVIRGESIEEVERESRAMTRLFTEVDMMLEGEAISIFASCHFGAAAAVFPAYCVVEGADEIQVLGLARKIEQTISRASFVGPTWIQKDPGNGAEYQHSPRDEVYFGPEREPKKKRRRGAGWRLGEGVLAGVAATALLAAGATAWRTLRPPPSAILDFGEPGTDADYRFAATGWECDVPAPRSEAPPRGKFCVLDIEVTNVSDTAKSLTGTTFIAHIDDDKYPAELSAGLMSGAPTIFPRRSIRGQVFFDVPDDETPDTIEVRGDYSSRGLRYRVPVPVRNP